jgi:hypothetical protein
MADIVAERLVRYLERAGYVVMKRPPLGDTQPSAGASRASVLDRLRIFSTLHGVISSTGFDVSRTSSGAPTNIAVVTASGLYALDFCAS